MPRNPKRPTDPNQLAAFIVGMSTGDVPAEPKPEKNAAAVELGRLGGLKGGKARAEKLTPAERSKIAKDAASARWESSKRKKN